MKADLRICLAVAAIIGCVIAGSTLGAAEIPGVSVSASSELFPGFNRRAVYLVDGSGLTGTAHTVTPDGFMWLSAGNGCCGVAPDPNPILTFDLGLLYTVNSMKVWNYNEGVPNLTARGINTANISVAGLDAVFSPLILGQSFNQAPGTNTDFSQNISLLGVPARYVRLSGMTHFPGGDNDFFGLSEVRFDGNLVGPPPPPPHPSIAPLLARASSEFTTDGRLAAHAVNGNGLGIGNTHVNNPPGGNMWLTDGVDAAPAYEIDLGGEYDLDQLRIWNYNENANANCCLDRGVQTADIYAAGADGIYGALPAAQATFARAPGASNVDFSETQPLTGARARYLLMQVTSNHGDPSFTGLSEVKVTGTGVPGKFPQPATVHSVSSELVGGFDRAARYSVNGAGRTFSDTHTSVPDGGMWLTNGSFGSPNDPQPEIVYDLGSEIDLDRMKVWNYAEYRPDLRSINRFNELRGRGVRFADVLVAGEDLIFIPILVNQEFDIVPDLDDVGDDAAELAALAELDFGQILDLHGVRARYIKFDIRSNHNGRDFNDPEGNDGFANFVGLSEVQFFAVPEPSTYGLASLALLGVACLRRRRG